jgi:hypothetical protein
LAFVLQFLTESQQDYLGRESAHRKAATFTGHHKQNKHRQISMPQVGFEPMTSVSEKAETVHVLDKGKIILRLCNGGIHVGMLLSLTSALLPLPLVYDEEPVNRS